MLHSMYIGISNLVRREIYRVSAKLESVRFILPVSASTWMEFFLRPLRNILKQLYSILKFFPFFSSSLIFFWRKISLKSQHPGKLIAFEHTKKIVNKRLRHSSVSFDWKVSERCWNLDWRRRGGGFTFLSREQEFLVDTMEISGDLLWSGVTEFQPNRKRYSREESGICLGGIGTCSECWGVWESETEIDYKR